MGFKDIQLDWLEEIVAPAIDLFYRTPTDQDLIARNAAERAIVANIYCKASLNLAQKQEAIQGMDDLIIDIEYNRNFLGPKKAFEKCRGCNKNDCLIKQEGYDIKKKYPDMLIHHRGFNDNNQVVIEFKKVRNNIPQARKDDFAKLVFFTCQEPFPNNEEKNYQFRIGFFIDIDTESYSVTTYLDTNKSETRIRQGGRWI